uniref:HNH endonuclease n=1 Tax=Steinernema glaseri TaxID=37863 RepID=A0A1I7ZUH4_9BILA
MDFVTAQWCFLPLSRDVDSPWIRVLRPEHVRLVDVARMNVAARCRSDHLFDQLNHLFENDDTWEGKVAFWPRLSRDGLHKT